MIHDLEHLAAVLAIVLFFMALRHRSTARAIRRAADRSTWAQASDSRPPHYPRRARPFGDKKGLR